MAWWEADADADYKDPKTWEDANPGYGDINDIADFAKAPCLGRPKPSSVPSAATSGCRAT
jgi:hypothetical protein